MSLKTDLFEVNIGPQHPSTHGVFRLKASLDGERIVDVEMIIGYLHRSMEKLAEERTWIQNIPFTDRMDYLSGVSNNLAYCLAVEELAGIRAPERANYLRVIFAELQRIANHAMAVGSFFNDLGAATFTPLIYMFREREKILDLFEMTFGARLTTNYIRIGGVSFDVPPEFGPGLEALLAEMPARIEEYENLICDNEIVLLRTRNVGVLRPETAIDFSISGPMLRSTGVAFDWRKARPYCGYERFDFDIPVGQVGDCYDRFRVRLEEVKQSCRIIEQAWREIPAGPVKADVPLALRPPVGEAYVPTEAPKGELGFYVVSDGGPTPYRWKVRSTSLINLSALKEMVVGQTIPDAIITLGSVDIVLGEVDR